LPSFYEYSANRSAAKPSTSNLALDSLSKNP
jgi:hypothetical protein